MFAGEGNPQPGCGKCIEASTSKLLRNRPTLLPEERETGFGENASREADPGYAAWGSSPQLSVGDPMFSLDPAGTVARTIPCRPTFWFLFFLISVKVRRRSPEEVEHMPLGSQFLGIGYETWTNLVSCLLSLVSLVSLVSCSLISYVHKRRVSALLRP